MILFGILLDKIDHDPKKSIYYLVPHVVILKNLNNLVISNLESGRIIVHTRILAKLRSFTKIFARDISNGKCTMLRWAERETAAKLERQPHDSSCTVLFLRVVHL